MNVCLSLGLDGPFNDKSTFDSRSRAHLPKILLVPHRFEVKDRNCHVEWIEYQETMNFGVQ